MGKRRWTDEHPEVEPAEVEAAEPLPDYDLPRKKTRQRTPRTDPALRDGDSGHGNPLESGGAGPSTDNDVGDAAGAEQPLAGPAGGAVGGTPAGKRARGGQGSPVRYRAPKRGDSTVGAKR
jgi:hypothetical protein